MKTIIKILSYNPLVSIIVIGVIIFYLMPETKTLIIVYQDNYVENNVKKTDERVFNIWDSGETFILNNSNRTIYLESIEYSTSSNSSYEPNVISIPKNSIKAHNSYINYKFKTPPNSVKISYTGTTTRWWLRR